MPRMITSEFPLIQPACDEHRNGNIGLCVIPSRGRRPCTCDHPCKCHTWNIYPYSRTLTIFLPGILKTIDDEACCVCTTFHALRNDLDLARVIRSRDQAHEYEIRYISGYPLPEMNNKQGNMQGACPRQVYPHDAVIQKPELQRTSYTVSMFK